MGKKDWFRVGVIGGGRGKEEMNLKLKFIPSIPSLYYKDDGYIFFKT